MFNPLQSRTLGISGDALPVSKGGTQVLMPVRLSGTEALGKLYEYALDLETVDTPTLRVWDAQALVVPDSLIGKVISISIEFEGKGTFIPGMPGDTGAGNVGAGTRTITGLITGVELTGSDDRRAYYRFIVRPWLWMATKNCESRLFQNLGVVEITEQVLKAYPFPVEMRLGSDGLKKGYPKRDYVRQFWQSDFDFLTMLWREWGLYYLFDGLTLVLCDSPGSHRKHNNAYDTIRYQAPDGARIDEEHIHRLKVSRRITAGQVDLVDYDYTRSRARFTASKDIYSKRSFDNVEQYRWGDYSQPLAGAMGLSGEPNDYQTEAQYLASVRVDAMRCRSLRLKGQGHLRGLTAGKTFWLENHPQQKVNAEYLVVSTTLDIRNVPEITQTSGSKTGTDSGEGRYQCVTDFVLQPANTFFKNRPKKKPRCDGETAVVVGPQNQPMWVDGYARIKIQFVWDRMGGNDQNSSCWVRVSSPWQGNGFGTIYLPRIGQEVTVSYHEGDPDKPYVSDRLVNQFNQPPWELPKNQALSGTLTRDLEGNQSNHLAADDTPGQLQIQMASDHAQSRLVLGYNTRIEAGTGRQQARGEGWELATESWGVARANRGMLITTETRSGAQAPAKDMGETVQRLVQARELHESLAELAQQNQAQDPGSDQSDVAKVIKAQTDAIYGKAGNSAEGNFAELAKPHLVLASPAGIETTTPQSTHLASGEHIALTSGEHVSLSVGARFLASVKKGIRLFCHQAGMKLIAAGGDIDLQALHDSVNILAKLNIVQTANRITITAKQEIIINGGGSYTKWSGGGVETGTAGMWIVHSASRSLVGPKSLSSSVPVTDVVQDGPHAIAIMAVAAQGQALEDATVSMFDPNQNRQMLHTVLDSNGMTRVVRDQSNQRYDALLGYDGWSANFEKALDDEYDAFDPGELDEDRELELL